MGKYTPVAIYTCDNCQQEINPPSNYGIDSAGNKHCYPCCAEFDRAYMIAHGAIMLYLVSKDEPPIDLSRSVVRNSAQRWFVTNWPDSLSFPVRGYPHKGKHNMARNRYDVWFVGPDNHIWHGVQYGDMTDICHCKRTKQVVAAPGAQ